MADWNHYWARYSVSKAEKWLILERDKILNTYLDKIDSARKDVLEVGCGYGSNIRLISRNRNDVQCYALDTSSVAIELVSAEIPNAVCADCRDTGFPSERFHLIFSAGLMEHFKAETLFLAEMRRILRHDGYLITFVPARFSLWKLYQLVQFGLWKHAYEKSYTCGGLKSLLINNGFDPVDIVGIDPFSINGFIMKLLHITFSSPIKRSFLESGYTELCIIGKKRFSAVV